MIGSDRAQGQDESGSIYFFLSYAHSPPLPGSFQSEPDQWVRRFFDDLKNAVARHARPQSRLGPGFCDQQTPLGSDWKTSVSQALGAAEVFVPLYSPRYLARSLPGREWACFLQRMTMAGVEHPMRRFAPVLWIPLPSGQDPPPDLQDAMAVGAPPRAYAENGLRALLRLEPYRDSYHQIVDGLAARIAEVAENSPVRPSAVPDIDEIKSQFSPEAAAAVFAVAVAAPSAQTLPGDRDPAGYGEDSVDWRPFLYDQDPPLADYAAGVAEQLDFAVLVTGIEKAGDRLGDKPGVILIDPWFAATDKGMDLLGSFARDLPSWVLPVIVISGPESSRAADLARQVRTILDEAEVAHTEAAGRAVRGVSSLREFVSLMPVLVAEAERQYLRYGPVRRSVAEPGFRPRQGGDVGPSASPAVPQHPSREDPDA